MIKKTNLKKEMKIIMFYLVEVKKDRIPNVNSYTIREINPKLVLTSIDKIFLQKFLLFQKLKSIQKLWE